MVLTVAFALIGVIIMLGIVGFLACLMFVGLLILLAVRDVISGVPHRRKLLSPPLWVAGHYA